MQYVHSQICTSIAIDIGPKAQPHADTQAPGAAQKKQEKNKKKSERAQRTPLRAAHSANSQMWGEQKKKRKKCR